MIQNEDLASVEGAEISGTDGPLGRAERVYRDDDTGALEWAVLATPAGARFVPLVDGEFTESGVRVPYSAEQVAQSPAADPDAGHLSRGQEADLYLHYGFDYDVSRLIQDRTTGMGAGGDPVGGVVTREGEASGPATGGPHSDDVDTGAVDADHEVRRGVLDAGVERRSPELLEGDGGETAGAAGFAGAATMGTGPGGTLMGTASTRSAAGTAAETDVSARDDLHVGTGTEHADRGQEIAGDSMIDMVRDPHDSGVADVGPRQSDVQRADDARPESADDAAGEDRR